MEEEEFDNSGGEINPKKTYTDGIMDKVGQDQIHGLLFGDKLSWQALIYELINTERLNPWDIDISLLAHKYLEKVKELEEANFFVSSKVLLAAALLLRMKSEILLEQDIPSLDAILYGIKDESKKYVQERIELDEELPDLIPRTPLPRTRKVSLEELMAALGNAIKTETRRIKKVVLDKQYEMDTAMVMPKGGVNLKDRINNIFHKVKEIFSNREERLAFSELAGEKIEDRVYTFIPLLHLDTQQKVFLEQEKHFEEIWIWLKTVYEKKFAVELEKMRKEAEEEADKMDESMSEEEKKRAEKLEDEFSEPLEGLEG